MVSFILHTSSSQLTYLASELAKFAQIHGLVEIESARCRDLHAIVTKFR